jgi:hypothetical protein
MKLASFRFDGRDRIGFSVDGFLIGLADVAAAICVLENPVRHFAK